MIDKHLLEPLADIFKAMGEVSRLQLLRQLMLHGELGVGQLAQATNLSQANVSKHLKHLAQCKLVSARKEGNFKIYAIDNPLVVQLCQMCCSHLEEG